MNERLKKVSTIKNSGICKITGKYSAFLITCITVIIVTHPGYSQSKFGFRNLFIGMGFNSSEYKIDFPEVRDFNPNTEIKKSLLIDLRFSFNIPKGLIFVPAFEFWSWGIFPVNSQEETQITLNEFKLNFDLAYPFKFSQRYVPYLGAGPGVHLIVVDALFPSNTYHIQTFRMIAEITEKRYRLGYNIFAGMELPLTSALTLKLETRWEKTNIIEQWKYLVGLSMF